MAKPIRSIVAIQQQLLRRFGGVTSVQRQFPLQGAWQSEAGVYLDLVVVLTVMDFGSWRQLLTSALKIKVRRD